MVLKKHQRHQTIPLKNVDIIFLSEWNTNESETKVERERKRKRRLFQIQGIDYKGPRRWCIRAKAKWYEGKKNWLNAENDFFSIFSFFLFFFSRLTFFFLHFEKKLYNRFILIEIVPFQKFRSFILIVCHCFVASENCVQYLFSCWIFQANFNHHKRSQMSECSFSVFFSVLLAFVCQKTKSRWNVILDSISLFRSVAYRSSMLPLPFSVVTQHRDSQFLALTIFQFYAKN